MAPTVCEVSVCRKRGFTFEDFLRSKLILSFLNDTVPEPIRPPKRRKVNREAEENSIPPRMGRVVDQATFREADGPTVGLRQRGPSELAKKENLIEIAAQTHRLVKQNRQLQRKLTAMALHSRALLEQQQKLNQKS